MSLSQQKYCEHLSLRKPTKVNKLVNSVEKPRGAVPKHGLPLWSQLRLDAKLPVLPGPKSQLAFSRNKLGHKLWHTTTPRTEFLLTDPNCLDVSYHYEALHDENLRSFFHRKANQKHIKELGLVDKSGEAICSLKDYNEYRRYLKRVHADAINRERLRQDARATEKNTLVKAKRYLHKDLDYQRRYAERMENMKQLKVQIEEGYAKRREQWLASMGRTAKRLQDITKRTNDDIVRRRQKMQALADNVYMRVAQGKYKARAKKLKTLKKWNEGEAKRKQRKAIGDAKSHALWEEDELRHWEMKVETQRRRIEREKQVLEDYAKTMAANVHARNLKVARQRISIEDALASRRMKKVKTASGKSHLWTIELMVNAFLKAWETEHNGSATVEEKRKIVASLMMQFAEAKNKPEGNEVLSILQEAKQKLDKEAFLPEPVTYAVDSLLNNVIEEFVKQNIEKVLTTVAEKAEGCTEQLEKIILLEERKKHDDPNPSSSHSARHRAASMQATTSRAGTTSIQSAGSNDPGLFTANKRMSVVVSPGEIVFLSSISETSMGGDNGHPGDTPHRRFSNPVEEHKPTRRTSGSGMPRASRIVSFGRITTLKDIMEGQSSETDKQFMKVKNRPPTPVPSLNEIVEAIFKEPVLLERDEHNAHLEKEQLDKTFLQMSKCLLNIVLSKALKEMQIRLKSNISRYPDMEPLHKKHITDKLANVILHNKEINFYECAEINFASDEIVRIMISKKRHSSLTVIPEGRRTSTLSTGTRKHSSIEETLKIAQVQLERKDSIEFKPISSTKRNQVKF